MRECFSSPWYHDARRRFVYKVLYSNLYRNIAIYGVVVLFAVFSTCLCPFMATICTYRRA